MKLNFFLLQIEETLVDACVYSRVFIYQFQPQSSKSVRPDGVPGLYFGYTDDKKHKVKVHKEKQV